MRARAWRRTPSGANGDVEGALPLSYGARGVPAARWGPARRVGKTGRVFSRGCVAPSDEEQSDPAIVREQSGLWGVPAQGGVPRSGEIRRISLDGFVEVKEWQ